MYTGGIAIGLYLQALSSDGAVGGPPDGIVLADGVTFVVLDDGVTYVIQG